MTTESILSIFDSELFGVWFLIGTAFVFWMQAGFAMVEAGFTRAKNTGNIIMKNLMDFCIGTVMWFLIGASMMMGQDGVPDILGFLGHPSFSVFTQYNNFNYSSFVFNLMFCATTATIVSGAMAERTKFSTYCIYSAIISGIIYPIEAHWTWGGGFLAQWGFHDYAGSNCIHMVGGICALIGAWMLGPRIGKFNKDKSGKIVSVNAFPGHHIAMGALGVFILWLGWYGFNGAAATDIDTLASVFLTTTVSPAVATVTAMLFTWFKWGKPDISMCLNASLAGLVAITASCDVTDCAGAAIIGVVAGLLVIFGIWFLDNVLRVDDPVGAVGVHMMNGIWGTIAVGLFATSSAPGFAKAGIMNGLFYGGGFAQLGKQLGGMGLTAAWTIVTIFIAFEILKHTIGLRVSEEEENLGLDICEHGLNSAYADFMPAPNSGVALSTSSYQTGAAPEVSAADLARSVPVVDKSASDTTFKNVVIFCKQSKFEDLKANLIQVGIMGLTVTQVLGFGAQKAPKDFYRGVAIERNLLPKIKVEVVVSKVPVADVVKAATNALYTGNPGDGKIFIYDVENVVRVRTGEVGYDALQYSEETN